MKIITGVILGFTILGCQENENSLSEFTGNEVVYALQPGSIYAINGTVKMKERKDGYTQVVIDLTGTEGQIQHPVHLHLGNISTPDADIAALLSPVLGVTGKSETMLKSLANEQEITFKQLVDLYACIKIHLAETGPERNIILAAGNIGLASQPDAGGRKGISICKSE